MQDEINFGCTEDFAELCALSTSGCLSIDEEGRLEAHVAVCAPCALLLNQYRALASAGMAMIAAERATDKTPEEKLQNAGHLKAKLFSTLASLQIRNAADGAGPRKRVIPGLLQGRQLFEVAAIAAMIVFAVAVGYLVGTGHRNRQVRSIVAHSSDAETTLKQRLANVQFQLSATRKNLAESSQMATNWQVQLEKAQKNLDDIRDAKTALEARFDALVEDGQRQNLAVADLTAQRDALSQKLSASEGKLQSVQQELKSARDDRQRSLLRTASFESQMDSMTAQMKEEENAVRRNDQYLAADRDVRDLMSARQLYIADVFDVDPRGKTRKPFGRVFYTKGKSLIFYAFDLDQQPGYREAKTFQVWGRSGSSETKAVSLGIFYLDSKENRRWALKYDDPKVLEEINALFVTVEPKGGSKRPTNKPFLLAYLHATAPNHP